MSISTLYQLSAAASGLAGICIILGTLLQDLLKNKKGAFFNFLGALIGLFGVTGVYLWQRAESGAFGLVAYLVVFLGLALIACTDFSGSFVYPNLSEDQVAQLGKSPAMIAIYISFLIFLVGEILFGISTIRAGVFPTAPTILFMIGFFLTIARAAYPKITFVGLTMSGCGLIWWGVSLWSLAVGA